MDKYPLATVRFGHRVPGRHAGERGIYNTYLLKFPDRDGRLTALNQQIKENLRKIRGIPMKRDAVPPLTLWFRDLREQRLRKQGSRLDRRVANTVRKLLTGPDAPRFVVSVSNGEEHVANFGERQDIAEKLSELQAFGRREQVFLRITRPELDLGRTDSKFIRTAQST